MALPKQNIHTSHHRHSLLAAVVNPARLASRSHQYETDASAGKTRLARFSSRVATCDAARFCCLTSDETKSAEVR